jgi:hypothetical protein
LDLWDKSIYYSIIYYLLELQFISILDYFNIEI